MSSLELTNPFQVDSPAVSCMRYSRLTALADPDIPFRGVCVGGGGGGHEMRLNAKGTDGSFGERKLIYIIKL